MYDFSKTIDRSKSNALKYTLRQQRFSTEDLLPIWVADMDLPTPSCIQEAIQQRLKHPIFGYELLPNSAKEAQIEWIARRYGKRYEPKQFLYSHSVVASMSVAIEAFSSKGDEIIIQPPIYPPFFEQVQRSRRIVRYNPLRVDAKGGYSFDLEQLQSIITPKSKLFMLCNPHNPVGRAWSKEELERLLEILKRHDIIIFSDEIHCDLVYKPHRHTPLSLLDGASRLTISAYGPSKSFNLAGLGVSSVYIENEALFERYKEVYERIHFAQGCSLGHIAFEAAYRCGEAWLEALKAHLMQNYKMLQEALAPFSTLIKLHPLEATYLAWLDCRGMGLSDSALREWFIKEAKLGLNAGISFGKEGSGHMRLNFAVSTQMMQQVVSQLKGALQRYADRLGRV